jgi:hypothetical protein
MYIYCFSIWNNDYSYLGSLGRATTYRNNPIFCHFSQEAKVSTFIVPAPGSMAVLTLAGIQQMETLLFVDTPPRRHLMKQFIDIYVTLSGFLPDGLLCKL